MHRHQYSVRAVVLLQVALCYFVSELNNIAVKAESAVDVSFQQLLSCTNNPTNCWKAGTLLNAKVQPAQGDHQLFTMQHSSLNLLQIFIFPDSKQYQMLLGFERSPIKLPVFVWEHYLNQISTRHWTPIEFPIQVKQKTTTAQKSTSIKITVAIIGSTETIAPKYILFAPVNISSESLSTCKEQVIQWPHNTTNRDVVSRNSQQVLGSVNGDGTGDHANGGVSGGVGVGNGGGGTLFALSSNGSALGSNTAPGVLGTVSTGSIGGGNGGSGGNSGSGSGSFSISDTDARTALWITVAILGVSVLTLATLLILRFGGVIGE